MSINMLPMQGPLFFSEGWGGRGLGGLVGGSNAGGRRAELPWPKYPISMICSLVILFSKDENHGNSDVSIFNSLCLENF